MASATMARSKLKRTMTGHALDKVLTYRAGADVDEGTSPRQPPLHTSEHHHHHTHMPLTEETLKRFAQDSLTPVLDEALATLLHDSRKEMQQLSERLRNDLRKEFLLVFDELANKDLGRQRRKPTTIETDLRQVAKVVEPEKRSSVIIQTTRFDRVLNEKLNTLKDDRRASVPQLEDPGSSKESTHSSGRNWARTTNNPLIQPRKRPLFLDDGVGGISNDAREDLVPMESPPIMPFQVPDITDHDTLTLSREERRTVILATGSPTKVEAWQPTPESSIVESSLVLSTEEQADKAAGFPAPHQPLNVYDSTNTEATSPSKHILSTPKSMSERSRGSKRRQQSSLFRGCNSDDSRISDRRILDAKKKTARIQDVIGKGWCELTAEEILTSTNFDNAIGIMIFLNALTIGIQTDYLAKNATDIVPVYFSAFEYIFLIIFTSELSFRLYVYRLDFFVMEKNLLWNWFDAVVVVAQLTEEILLLIARASDEFDNDQWGSLKLTRVLRVLRVMRILRVMRVLHLITELRTIVSSIAGSMRSLIWTLVLLLLMIYIVGVYFTQSVSEHMVDVIDDAGALPGNQTNQAYIFNEHQEVIKVYFGSLSRTILTLYQAMSGGIDWDSIADPMIREIGWLYGIAIAAYVAFATLALLNVVTGVFVQTALQSAKEAEDSFMTDQVITLFKATDFDHSLSLTWRELEETLYSNETAAFWKSIDVRPEEAKILFDLLDTNDSEEIEFEQFLWGCLRLRGPAKAMDLLTLMQEQRRNTGEMKEFISLAEHRLLDVKTLPDIEETVTKLGCRFDEMLEVLEENQVTMRLLRTSLQEMERSQQEISSGFRIFSSLGCDGNMENFDTTISTLATTLGPGDHSVDQLV